MVWSKIIEINGENLFKITAETVRLTLLASVVVIAQYLTVKMHMEDEYMHLNDMEFVALKKVEQGFPYNDQERKLLHDTATNFMALSRRFEMYDNENRFQTPQQKAKLAQRLIEKNNAEIASLSAALNQLITKLEERLGALEGVRE